MTVTAVTRKAGPTPGNGATTVFPFGWKTFAKADLIVELLTIATGVKSTLVLDDPSGYSVTLNPDQDAAPGGSITYNPLGVPMPATQSLTITSGMAETQALHLINGGSFNADNVEDMGDRGMMAIQDLALKVNSAIRFPAVDSSGLTAILPVASLRANLSLGFDASGNVALGTSFVSPSSSPSYVNLTLTGSTLTLSGATGIVQASAGPLSLRTAAGEQVQVLNTAGVTRSITLTGSNGGNPTISTSGGSLAITPATVIAGGLTVSTLTNTRVPFAGAGGLLSDSANFTYSGSLLSVLNSGAGNALTLSSSGAVTTFTLSDTGANGCGIMITGNGGVTPTKTIRVNAGQFQIVNSAFGAVPFAMTDAGDVAITGALTVNSAVLIKTNTSLTNNAAAAAGTLLNAPTAGNPTKWFPINDNGTTRNIPAW